MTPLIRSLLLGASLGASGLATASDSPIYEKFRRSVFDLDRTLAQDGFKTVHCKWVPNARPDARIPFEKLKGQPSQRTGACLFESALANLLSLNPRPGYVATQLNLPRDAAGAPPVQATLEWTPYRIFEPVHNWREALLVLPEGWQNAGKTWQNIGRLATHYYQTKLLMRFAPAVDPQRLLPNDLAIRLLIGRPQLKISRLEIRINPRSKAGVAGSAEPWQSDTQLVLYAEGSDTPATTIELRSEWTPLPQYSFVSLEQIFRGRPWLKDTRNPRPEFELENRPEPEPTEPTEPPKDKHIP
jgi:hypothetical protein